MCLRLGVQVILRLALVRFSVNSVLHQTVLDHQGNFGIHLVVVFLFFAAGQKYQMPSYAANSFAVN